MSTSLRRWIAVVIVGGLAGFGGAAAATTTFTDVRPESEFAEHISNVQEAGIASGFPDGSFHPRDNLNRQQAAAWIDRSTGRVAIDWFGENTTVSHLDSANPSATVAEVEATSVAAGDGVGYVTLHGAVGGVDGQADDTCPCVVNVYVRDEADNLVARSGLTLMNDPSYEAAVISPIIAVVPIEAGETHTYRVDISLLDPADTVEVGAVLYSLYAPSATGVPDDGGWESNPVDRPENPLPN